MPFTPFVSTRGAAAFTPYTGAAPNSAALTDDQVGNLTLSPVARGFRSGLRGYAAAGHAYMGQLDKVLGDTAGAQQHFAAADTAQADANNWAPPVGSLDQATQSGDYLDYARGLAGETAAQALPAVVGGAALRGIPKGGMIGAAAGMFPQMAGNEVLAARADPHNANLSDGQLLGESTLVGGLGAGMMGFVPGGMIDRVAGDAAPVARGLKASVAHIGNKGVDSAIEGGLMSGGATALSQTGQSYLDPQRDTRNDPAAMREAVISGALGGFPMGAAGGAAEALHGNFKAGRNAAVDTAQRVTAATPGAMQTAADTARTLGGQAVDAAGNALDAAQDTYVGSGARDAVHDTASAAGQAVQNMGVPSLDGLKQYIKDKNLSGMATDALDRFKQMTSRSDDPAAEAWLAGTQVPDAVRAQGLRAIMDYNAQNNPKRTELAQRYAGELVADPQTPDNVKQQIVGMNGDYNDQRHQQFIAQARAAQRAGVDLSGRLDAVTRAIKQAVGPTDSRKANQALGYQMSQQHTALDLAVADAVKKHLPADATLHADPAKLMDAAKAIQSFVLNEHGRYDERAGDNRQIPTSLHRAFGKQTLPMLDLVEKIMQRGGLTDHPGLDLAQGRKDQDRKAALQNAMTRANKGSSLFTDRVKGIIASHLHPQLMAHVEPQHLASLTERISRFLRGDGTHDMKPQQYRDHVDNFMGDMHALFGDHLPDALEEIYAEHDKLHGPIKGDTPTGHMQGDRTVAHEDSGDYRHTDYDNRPTEHDAKMFHHTADSSRDNERLFPSVKDHNAAEYGYTDAVGKKIDRLMAQYPSDKVERISGRDWAQETGHKAEHIAQEIVREKPALAPELERLGAEEFLHQHTEAIRRTGYTPDEHDLSDADLKAMRADTKKARDHTSGKITVLDRNGREVAFSAHAITMHMFKKFGKNFTLKDYDGLPKNLLGDLFAHGLSTIMHDQRFGHNGEFFADTTKRNMSAGKEYVDPKTGEILRRDVHFSDDLLIARRKDGSTVTYGDIRRYVDPWMQHELTIANSGLGRWARNEVAKAHDHATVTKRDDSILEGEDAGKYRMAALRNMAKEDSPRGEAVKWALDRAKPEFDPWEHQSQAAEEPTAHNYEDTVDGPREFDPNHGGLTPDTPLKGSDPTHSVRDAGLLDRLDAAGREPTAQERQAQAEADQQKKLDSRDYFDAIEAAAQAHADADFGRHALGDDAYQYSKSSIGPTPMDKAARAKVKDYIQRVLGDAVKVLIKKDLGHTGDFSVADGLETIRLSSLAADPMQAAFHEAFHAFARRLGDTDGGRQLIETLQKAAQGDFVQGQLKKLLKNEKDALKQLKDPHEAMAYMYQFWAARDARGEPMLHLGPKADGLFAKISQFFDKVRRILRGDPNANDILSYFHSGEFQTEHANGLSEATLHNIAAYTQAARDNGSVKGLKKATEGLYKVFATADARMRDMKIPEFTQMADLFQPSLGAKNKDMGYLQAKMQKGDQFLSRLNRIFDGFSREDAAAALEHLQDNQSDVKLNGKQQKAVAQVKAFLDDMHAYMKDAKMDLRYVGTQDQAYFPRVWDTDYIMAHAKEFRAMLETYERNHKLSPGATDGIMSRLLQTNGFDDITEGEGRAGYAPGMAAANERVLRMLKASDAAPFLQKDLSVALSTYVGQAVARAEYTRRFGGKGEVLDGLMKKAKANGATPEQLDTARKYIMAMEGTLGNDISMMNRKIQGGLMVYQNYRLLPLSLFSNLIDPFGIVVRGGSMRDAFSTFMRGFQEIGHEFGQGEPDAMRKLAEDLGVIVDHSTMSSMGNLYNSQYFLGWQKKANDGLFKYNLMEGWNKSMRAGALKAAVGFVERHAAAAGKKNPDETSLRYLAELNLKPEDVQLDKKGRLTNLDDEKVQQALYRWVDEAIMRPNASQRPIYGSDPHYMAVFHLKQFTYTFYKQIMGRAFHEAKHGNLAPAFTLLGYVPMMVAADAARGMVTGMLGGKPTQNQDDDLWGTFEHGWERAGLNGPAQFGVDGIRAYQHGNLPFINMLGPSGEQAAEVGEDLAHHDMSRSMRRAPPLAQLFNPDMAAKGED